MMDLLFNIATQCVTFIPLALGISISYHLLRATDMTIDSSFVLGAAVFAKLITLGFSPYLALVIAILGGMLAGVMVATIQRRGRIDPLLAGVLATFILSGFNLVLMGKPNIGLLDQTTLVSPAFAINDYLGWALTSLYAFLFCALAYFILSTRFGLTLRAFGDNPNLLKRLGKNIEAYRIAGFALTNGLAAASGCLTAQTVGYADIGMGFGMTLTGIGAIIIGQQLLKRIYQNTLFRFGKELIACLIGVFSYFLAMNILLKLNVDPIYLKMILGVLLILCLRVATKTPTINS